MSKKQSGLGRGLGDLLEDNMPDIRSGKPSVIKKAEGNEAESVPAEATLGTAKSPVPPTAAKPTPQVRPTELYDTTPKSLYEEKPRNRSLKANFRNFNR